MREMHCERVYERILSRVEREELNDKCRDVAQREAKLIERRIRGAQRALQHAYDVEAARQRLACETGNTASTAVLLKDIAKLQSKIASRMQRIARAVTSGPAAAGDGRELVKTKAEPAPEKETRGLEEPHTPTKHKRLKRRLSQDLVDSPRKPPRPGCLAILDEGASEEDEREHTQQGPHAMPLANDDEETEDDIPMDLDVLDSDTEFEAAAYLEKARRLRKISSERRMSELPGLIRAVLAEIERHEWTAMPRELLGALSATLGAATTLKPAQRRVLHAELTSLQAVVILIDETRARQYPTLLGSRARFLSSLDETQDNPETGSARTEPAVQPLANDDTSDVASATIEKLHAATSSLVQRVHDADELKSMEQIDEILQLVDHVFDNPTLARSERYSAMVAVSLDTLIKYVNAIPHNTRRKLQCEDSLHRRRAQISGLEV